MRQKINLWKMKLILCYRCFVWGKTMLSKKKLCNEKGQFFCHFTLTGYLTWVWLVWHPCKKFVQICEIVSNCLYPRELPLDLGCTQQLSTKYEHVNIFYLTTFQSPYAFYTIEKLRYIIKFFINSLLLDFTLSLILLSNTSNAVIE